MDIEEIRRRCRDELIEVTNHIVCRCLQRNISYSDMKQAILNGKIIEEYPNDYPYPSCLISGYSADNRMIHVVVGLGERKLWLITAYRPDYEHWEDGFLKRKE